MENYNNKITVNKIHNKNNLHQIHWHKEAYCCQKNITGSTEYCKVVGNTTIDNFNQKVSKFLNIETKKVLAEIGYLKAKRAQ